MSEQIETQTLIEAVADFLGTLPLEGQQAFHAKVAIGALGIVAREITQSPRTAEEAALAGFLGHEAPLDTLRAELCGRLQRRQLTPESPGLLDALTTAALAKLAVDNPRYSTFKRMQDA
jgi:hypothetical protein